MKNILIIVAVMTIAIIFGYKLAVLLLGIGVFVMLIGVGAAASCVASIKSNGHCTDENSPLVNAIFGEKDE